MTDVNRAIGLLGGAHQIAYKGFMGYRDLDRDTCATCWNTSPIRSNGSAWTRRKSSRGSTKNMAIPRMKPPT